VGRGSIKAPPREGFGEGSDPSVNDQQYPYKRGEDRGCGSFFGRGEGSKTAQPLRAEHQGLPVVVFTLS